MIYVNILHKFIHCTYKKLSYLSSQDFYLVTSFFSASIPMNHWTFIGIEVEEKVFMEWKHPCFYQCIEWKHLCFHPEKAIFSGKKFRKTKFSCWQQGCCQYIVPPAYYIFIPLGFNINKLTAWGGQNVHRPAEEALLPINNPEKMSRKHEMCNIIDFFKNKLMEKVVVWLNSLSYVNL